MFDKNNIINIVFILIIIYFTFSFFDDMTNSAENTYTKASHEDDQQEHQHSFFEKFSLLDDITKLAKNTYAKVSHEVAHQASKEVAHQV